MIKIRDTLCLIKHYSVIYVTKTAKIISIAGQCI